MVNFNKIEKTNFFKGLCEGAEECCRVNKGIKKNIVSMDRKTILDYFAKFIYKELGIVYGEEVYYQLETRLNNIVSQLDYPSLDDFYNQTISGLPSSHLNKLLDIATNNETSFFRDEPVFTSLFEVFRAYFSDPGARFPYKIWCAASSTGQEPYSVAILLEEVMELTGRGSFEMKATDISEKVLNYASDGVYTSMEVGRGLNENRLNRYFESAGHHSSSDKWKIKDEIKSKVQFSKQNLLNNLSFSGPFDMILCRNVLLYQDIPHKKEIVEKMRSLMTQDGILVLGGGENMLGVSDMYEPVVIAGSTFFQPAKY